MGPRCRLTAKTHTEEAMKYIAITPARDEAGCRNYRPAAQKLICGLIIGSLLTTNLSTGHLKSSIRRGAT